MAGIWGSLMTSSNFTTAISEVLCEWLIKGNLI